MNVNLFYTAGYLLFKNALICLSFVIFFPAFSSLPASSA